MPTLSLEEINACIEALQAEGNAAHQGAIARLEHEAAHLIQTRAETRLEPIVRAYEAALRDARRLLAPGPYGATRRDPPKP